MSWSVAPEVDQTIRVELLHRESKTSLKAPRTLKNSQWPPNYDEVKVWRRAMLAKYEVDPAFLEGAKKFYANGPRGCIAFINHWCDTFDTRETGFGSAVASKSAGAWMPFILFTRQEELVRFVLECLRDDEAGLVEKARTMGASWICIAISVWLWLFHPGTSIGWGSQKAENVDEIGNPKSIFWKIRELINRIPDVFKPAILSDSDIKQGLCHNPDNGATIAGEVGDNIGRGGRTRVFFKDESAHYLHPELIEAALSENTRVPIDISSVNGLGNLFYKKRKAGKDWYPGAKIEPGYIRVFVMDSHDHPEYDKEWHDKKRAYHIRQGTPHIYAQEIERNYAASVTGVIVNKEWLDECFDSHVKLGIPLTGGKMSALDIGDSKDGDNNAQVARTGILLNYAEEWVARDPGVTARKAMGTCRKYKIKELQYDAAGGLGSAVKSEANRFKDEGFDTRVFCVPWNAGGKVLFPGDRVNDSDSEKDEEAPRNKNFFANLKAQAWWKFAQRVYRTWCAVKSGGKYNAETGQVDCPEWELNGDIVPATSYDADELISIDSKLALRHKIVDELCQPTASQGAKLKLVVDKAPDGTRSPNLGDAVVMCYWPMPRAGVEFVDIGLGGKVFVGGEPLSL